MKNIKKKKKDSGLRKERIQFNSPPLTPFPDLFIKEYWDTTREQPNPDGVMLWRTRIEVKDDL